MGYWNYRSKGGTNYLVKETDAVQNETGEEDVFAVGNEMKTEYRDVKEDRGFSVLFATST